MFESLKWHSAVLGKACRRLVLNKASLITWQFILFAKLHLTQKSHFSVLALCLIYVTTYTIQPYALVCNSIWLPFNMVNTRHVKDSLPSTWSIFSSYSTFAEVKQEQTVSKSFIFGSTEELFFAQQNKSLQNKGKKQDQQKYQD